MDSAKSQEAIVGTGTQQVDISDIVLQDEKSGIVLVPSSHTARQSFQSWDDSSVLCSQVSAIIKAGEASDVSTVDNGLTTETEAGCPLLRDEIVARTKAVLHGLETLKVENTKMLASLGATLEAGGEQVSKESQDGIVEAKTKVFNQLLESLELGIGESEVMLALAENLEIVEAAQSMDRIKIARMQEENAMLREEMAYLQEKLLFSSAQYVKLEEEMSHLKYLKELKDLDTVVTDEGCLLTSAKESLSTTLNNLDLGFPEDEEENSADGQSNAYNQAAGCEIPERVHVLHNLVLEYASQRRYEVAIPLCKRAIADLEKSSGRETAEIATMLNILALVYRDQGKYKEAASLLNESLAIRERVLGSDSPAVAATMNNLSVLFGKRGKFREAEPLCKRALLIKERVHGKDHPEVARQLNNLALLCQNQGKYEEVELYYRSALEIYAQKLPPGDINIAKTKNNLASVYMKQGKYIEAEQLFKSVLTQAESDSTGVDGEVRPIWVVAEENEENKGKNRDRLQYGWTKQSKLNGPTLSATLRNLTALYKRQGKNEAAATLEDFLSQKPSTGSVHLAVGSSKPETTGEGSRATATGPSSLRVDPSEDVTDWTPDLVDEPTKHSRGTMSKLGASLVRGSYKFVQKLAGSYSRPDSSVSKMKRASSLTNLSVNTSNSTGSKKPTSPAIKLSLWPSKPTTTEYINQAY